jgi:Zn-dependent protease
MRPELEASQREAGNAEAPRKRGALGAAGAGLLAIAVKGKALFAIAKALPFAKVLLTFGTFGLSIFAYAMRNGLAFGVGFVTLLLIHELGHGMAMRAAGIRAGWPVFIPFFGAFISMKDKPAHPAIEARIAYAGPVAGTAGALVCAAIGLFLHKPFFLALAYFGFFLNLFNLVPMGFLDGARIARVFSRGAWIVGVILLGALFLVSPSPQLAIIGVMGLVHVFRRSGSGEDEDLAAVTDADRKIWAFRYFGLCFFLGAATFFTHQLLERRGF